MKKQRRLWLFGALFGALLALFLMVSYRVRADFAYTPTLLSHPDAACDAVEPRAASNVQSNWIAVIWIQGMPDSGGLCKTSGNAVLRMATEGAALTDWSDRIVVFDGDPDATCAIHTDVAVTGTVAHVVTSVRNPCLAQAGDSQTTAIHYGTCDLTTAPAISCTDEIAVQLDASSSSDPRVNDVRIALDGQGRPHLAYSTTSFFGTNGEIWYHRNLGGGWTAESPQKMSVELSGGSTTANVAYRPNIAWGSYGGEGRAHVVWESHRDELLGDGALSYDGEVYYRSCADDGDCDETPQTIGFAQGTKWPQESTHPNPVVAARGSSVVILWNNCEDIDYQNEPCSAFGLQYRRSDDNGATFVPQVAEEVSTGYDLGSFDITREYTGTDAYGDTSGDQPEYEKFLRPALALDAQGYPHAAWQVRYEIGVLKPYLLQTDIVTGTKAGGSSLYWLDEDWDWIVDYETYGYIMPQILVPQASVAHRGVHLFYMRDDRAGPYQIYYDYLGQDRAEPTPTATPRCGVREDDPCLVYLPLSRR